MTIRKLIPSDRNAYIAMAKDFYTSPAVLHDIPDTYIEDCFDEMIRSDIYAEGFLIVDEQEQAIGYGIVSKSYSQECGGQVIWLEELSILPSFQNKGLGKAYFSFIQAYYPQCKRFRLEVEKDNTRAISLYKELGYEELTYYQMVREVPCN